MMRDSHEVSLILSIRVFPLLLLRAGKSLCSQGSSNGHDAIEIFLVKVILKEGLKKKVNDRMV